MRFFEFSRTNRIDTDQLNGLTTVIKTLIGRYAEKRLPGIISWNAFGNILKSAKLEPLADYETFKMAHDNYSQISDLVSNFDAKTLTLKIPGMDQMSGTLDATDGAQDSVDQIAASAAPQQMAQTQQVGNL